MAVPQVESTRQARFVPQLNGTQIMEAQCPVDPLPKITILDRYIPTKILPSPAISTPVIQAKGQALANVTAGRNNGQPAGTVERFDGTTDWGESAIRKPGGLGAAMSGTLVSGKAEGRTRPDQITFYRNVGNQGLQFSAVGQIVYRKALASGAAREIPTEWFLQDIRD